MKANLFAPIAIVMVLFTLSLRADNTAAIAGSNVIRASVASDGVEGNGASYTPALSADGRYIAFTSNASNLVDGDTNGQSDVFIYDRVTSQTERVSVAADGTEGNDQSWAPAISADGRYVAFVSYASNLVIGDTNGDEDVFVHDRLTGQTERVSVSSSGAQGNDASIDPAISADGRYVAFYSDADNLVSNDQNNDSDVFVHDRLTSQTTMVSVGSDGSQGIWESFGPSLSADGRYITFTSENDLVAADDNNCMDIYVHDRETHQTSRVSVASDGAEANDSSEFSTISADGRYVSFSSWASNLVSGDTNDRLDVFIHDRVTDQTTRVSIASDGSQAIGTLGELYYVASISGDGRYVTFHSNASNLVPGDTNAVEDVFEHDRIMGQTSRISTATNGAQANDASGENYWESAVSADGSIIAFTSKANNLVSDDTNTVSDIFVYSQVDQGWSIYLPLMSKTGY